MYLKAFGHIQLTFENFILGLLIGLTIGHILGFIVGFIAGVNVVQSQLPLASMKNVSRYMSHMSMLKNRRTSKYTKLGLYKNTVI